MAAIMKTTAEVNAHVIDTEKFKAFRSAKYNYLFNKTNGYFARWGKRPEDDPEMAPAPEILDLEISVNGCPNNCHFCYKGNNSGKPTNMSLDTFKLIFDKMPKSLSQIAFGITGMQTNPDFIPMMEYSRAHGVIPNFTLSGIDVTPELARTVSKLVGALAVSAYESDKNICYNTVKIFTDLGVKQTNIHLLVSNETLPFVYEVLADRLNDERLANLNAIVFLGVKPKGRARKGYSSVPSTEYAKLVKHCMDANITFGFDSCSAPKFESAVRESNYLSDEQKTRLIESSESCESSIFSSYINVDGIYWHCSFSENESGIKGINVLEANDFVKDVWNAPEAIKFRTKLLHTQVGGCRHCPVYPEINK